MFKPGFLMPFTAFGKIVSGQTVESAKENAAHLVALDYRFHAKAQREDTQSKCCAFSGAVLFAPRTGGIHPTVIDPDGGRMVFVRVRGM